MPVPTAHARPFIAPKPPRRWAPKAPEVMELIDYEGPTAKCIFNGKTMFRDATKACVAAITATLESGQTIVIYECTGCGTFHLTRNRDGKYHELVADFEMLAAA